jgi:hypothetical protein
MQQMLTSHKHPDRIPVVLLAEDTLSPVRCAQIQITPARFSEGAGDGEVIMPGKLMTERMAKEHLKWYLMNKYRTLLTDKLTPQDLEEFQYCLRHQYDPERGWDREYLTRFVLKIREYMQEDILKREIAGIESLLTLMKPEDLNHERNDLPPPYDTGPGPEPSGNFRYHGCRNSG